jgi:hypothetical protein
MFQCLDGQKPDKDSIVGFPPSCIVLLSAFLCFVLIYNTIEFYYSVTNEREPFIYLDLMVKNGEVLIERYFK